MPVRNFTLLISLVANVAALIALSVLLLRRPDRSPSTAQTQPSTSVTSDVGCPPCPATGVESARQEVECPKPVREPPPPPVLASADLSREPERTPRFTVCEHAPLPVDIRDLGAFGAGRLASVHCGDSVHLLGFDAAGTRRVARLDKALPKQRNLHFLSAPVRTADINGDALPDVLLGFALADERDSPRGGSLFSLIQARSGAFEPPRYLGGWTVSGLATGRFRSDTRGADIAVLQREDARLGRQSQLILLRGGPSPTPLASLKVDDGLSHVDTLDLDLDGRSELLLSGDGTQAEIVALDPQGAVQKRTHLDLAEPYQLSLVDLDADGHDDALFVGARVQALLASATRDAEPNLRLLKTAPPTALARSYALDLDADGRKDLLALGEAELLPLRFRPPDELEVAAAQHLDALESQGFAVSALLAIPREPGKLWLATVAQARAAPYEIDVALSQLDPGSLTLAWNQQRIALPDAPLSLHWSLP
jgi:hypothetical protein